ncbi:hypothetical protein [Spirochaeta cellobiosiphila]|uniref:hypothetical protein n=1 Tax=Spirochaeta cellobiosiphila TaxID=504483 RepID=UPI0012EBA3D1|nr:hypothetical protein [Spirochaeta cellobiosiphila]
MSACTSVPIVSDTIMYESIELGTIKLTPCPVPPVEISENIYPASFPWNIFDPILIPFEENNVIALKDEKHLKQQPMLTKVPYIAESPDSGGNSKVLKTVTTQITDPVSITLEGEAWTISDLDGDNDGLVYDNTRIQNGKTSFNFLPKKVGQYKLSFQQQDLSTGTITVKDFEIIVIRSTDNSNDRFNNDTTKVKTSVLLFSSTDEKNLINISDQYPIVVNISIIGMEKDSTVYYYAKYLEENDKLRNIYLSYALYGHLVKTFPQSQYYFQSKERVNYLEQHYFMIR